MRTYTLLLSVLVHVCAIIAISLSPLLASVSLPELASRAQWTPVIAADLPTPSPQPPGTRDLVPAMARVPVDAPVGLHLEDPSAAPQGGVSGLDETAGLGNGTTFFGNEVPGGVGDGPPAEIPPPPPPAPVRVGGVIERPTKVVDVAPVYPALALRSRTEGSVILEATIGENGDVRDVRVLRSIPLLDAAAIEAVRQWRFTPTRLNGQPVSVLMTVTVTFRLDG